jgi:nitrate/nitrite transporter NarK
MFLNFSTHYFIVRFGESPTAAAYVTSMASVLVVFLGPVGGVLVDSLGGQLGVCLTTSVVVVAAYYLLAYTMVNPLVGVIMLSVGESFIPIIVMALIPSTVPANRYGTAFGIMEVTGAIASFVGNVAMGYAMDVTQSYGVAMDSLLGLSAVGMFLFIALAIADVALGYKMSSRTPVVTETLSAIDE